MRKSGSWRIAGLLLAALVIVTVAGCGGGGGGGTPPTPAQTGSVSGEIKNFYPPYQGLGGVTVTVDGQTAVSDANGLFQVTGVSPGRHTVTITPPSWLALPPGTGAITVDVLAGQDTDLTSPVLLIDSADLPPAPPT